MYILYTTSGDIFSQNKNIFKSQIMKKRKREVTVSNKKVKITLEECHTTIKMKLGSFLKYSTLTQPFLQTITSNIKELSYIQYLACMFINFHWLRLLEEDKELPVLNQSFLLKCCIIVTDTERTNADGELVISFEQFQSLYNFTKPKNEYLGNFICALSRQMYTNLVNHIVMNTNPHMIKYVRFKYQLKDKQDAIYFINQTFSNTYPKIKDYSDFQEWCKYDPFYDKNIENNMNHFIKLSWDMLKFQEPLPERTKGKKTFTLFPLKNDYVASSILINKTTIYNLLQQMGIENRGVLLRQLDSEDEELKTALQNKNHTISHTLVQKVYEQIFHVFFNYKKFERKNVKFDFSLYTNGYAICPLFVKPKHEFKEQKEIDYNEFERFGAIDPGVGSPITAYVSDSLFGQNSKIEKNKPIHFSAKEYQHRAKFTKQKQWNERLKNMNPNYKKVITEMPSMKTGSVEIMKKAIQYRLQHFHYLFEFSATKPFLKWRFTTYVYSQKALEYISKKVVDNKKTLIGFGDWSQHDGFVKGHRKAPLNRTKRVLRKYCTLLEVDEYNTSQMCSCCCEGVKMERAKLAKTKNGEIKIVSCFKVLSCTTCNILWNRDVNASRNIFMAFRNQLSGLQRPEHIQRTTKVSSSTHIERSVYPQLIENLK
jgi:transposase